MLAFVPAAFAIRGSGLTFARLARDVVEGDVRTLDVLGRQPRASVLVLCLVVAFVFGSAAIAAWLRGAFIRSLAERRLVYWPGRTVFARLAAYYALTGLLALGAEALGRAAVLPGLVALLLLNVLFAYGDYAIVIDDLPLLGGLRRSLELLRFRPGPTMTMVWVAFALSALEAVAFVSPLEDGNGVFPPFLLALVLAAALVDYVVDCGLLAIFAERPRPAAPS